MLDDKFRTPSRKETSQSQFLNDYLDEEVEDINSRPVSSMEAKLKKIIKDNSNFELKKDESKKVCYSNKVSRKTNKRYAQS